MNTFTDYDEYIKSKVWRPFTTDKGRNYYKRNDSQMTDYTDPKYKNLYEEILLDYHYRFPKFHPIPYLNEQQSVLRRNQSTDAKTNPRSNK